MEVLASGIFVIKSQNFATQLKDQIGHDAFEPELTGMTKEAKRLAFFPAWSRRHCHFAALLPQTGD
jgi:hypothetical protein